MDVTIRYAKVDDAPAIAAAEREIAKEPGFFCSQPAELTDEQVIDTISTFLNEKTGVYLVAEYEGHLIGHAFLQPFRLQSLRHVADLNIAVHLGWQKKGIGTRLLGQIIEWAKSSGTIEKIQLNVRATNLTAISLYKKMGFEEEGRLKHRVKVDNGYIDDLIMGLDLTRDQHQELNIRSMKDQDIDILIKQFCFPWTSTQATTEKWIHYYNEHQNQIRTVFLIEKQGQIIGYGSLLHLSEYPAFKNTRIPEIHDVWIAEDWRNRGFGKMLIKCLEEAARTNGYQQIGLGVGLYKDYGSAQKLYFQLGYMPDGHGATYKYQPVVPGEKYPLDDDLIIWLKKNL